MAGEDVGDVFAIPDLWRPSKWLDMAHLDQTEFFSLDVKAADKETHTPVISKGFPNFTSDEFFKLPTALEPLALHVGAQSPDEEPGPNSEREVDGPPEADLFGDAWIAAEDVVSKTAEFKSWDGFLMPEIPSMDPLFLTEAGPAAYDAVLQTSDDPLAMNGVGDNVVETHPYLTGLLALSLGRTSIFFTWDEQTNTFFQSLENLRVSGCSANVLQGIQRRCLQCGTISRILFVFVQITYKTRPSAGRVALAKCVDSLLLAIQTKLGNQARQITSLLQLQSAIQPVHAVLTYFNSLIIKLNRGRTDEQILSIIFEETQALEYGDDLLGGIMQEVLTRVTEPWANFVQKWIGLKPEGGSPMTKDGPSKSFVKVENVAYIDDAGLEVDEPDYILDERRIPTFLSRDIAQSMFETGRNLRLLRTHHPDHPLCHVEFVQSKSPPNFEWHYDWNSIDQLQKDVERYEASLMDASRHGYSRHIQVVEYGTPSVDDGYKLQLFGQGENQLLEQLQISIKKLDGPLPTVADADRLTQLFHDRLLEGGNEPENIALSSAPHWSLLPLLSFNPLVEAQARQINREYLKLLFFSHKLRDHIALQREFQLLGNGLFCSRLSHALFDPELETAERQRGVARRGGVMGLRLGTRDTWPPASSELRLALMGVLSETYHSDSRQKPKTKLDHTLPGDLSFAVRDLSDPEIEKCMNPESLEALDFLRLSYKTPAALAPVLTPVILIKHDKIFKMLLRMLRILYVAGELYRDTTSRTSRWDDIDNASFHFRVTVQHFVESITKYFLDTGIARPWSRFENWLDKVQTSFEDDNFGPGGSRVISPDEVREQYEHTLDQIMHTLLLRKRQQPVLKVLEDIFTLILSFSKFARLRAMGAPPEQLGESSPADLYMAFRKKVDIFITVCRGLSERSGHRSVPKRDELTSNEKDHGSKDENTIDQLLIVLEMSGYYGGSRV
ncbi:Spc98 family-domain-containing protein [Xylariales sp. PMI_506]|nr:Spc98 family-domain-containing protein [Xylariales sp. PMI_506]